MVFFALSDFFLKTLDNIGQFLCTVFLQFLNRFLFRMELLIELFDDEFLGKKISTSEESFL